MEYETVSGAARAIMTFQLGDDPTPLLRAANCMREEVLRLSETLFDLRVNESVDQQFSTNESMSPQC